jgi:tetratricopeptide (TPR) repeat protein
VLFLAALAVLPYLNTLPNRFVYDDAKQILQNPYLENFHHLKEIFTTPVWSFLGGDYARNYYRPLMSLGYLLCYQAFGPRPLPFHVVNLVLNLLVVLLLYLVTARLFEDRRVAWLAAGLFAIHPIHSESVAWIAAVTDLELAVFYLLTFWFFLGLPQRRGTSLVIGQLLMAASFALALLAKEPAVTLVLLAAFYEHFCRADHRETRPLTKFGRYGPLGLVALIYLIARTHFVGGLAGKSHFPNMGPDIVLFCALALAGQYVWKLFWPANLCAFYTFHLSTGLSDPRVLAGGLALLALAFLTVFFWNRNRLVSFALLFFFVNLLPVLYAPWMAANVFAERYLYLPSVGFCWVLGWVGANAWRWARRRGGPWPQAAVACVVLIAVLGAVRIIRRNRDWHDDETFYQAVLAQQPDAYIMHINLGALYLDRDDLPRAEQELRAADKLAPDYPLTLNNLALLSLKQKRYADALGFLIRSLLKQPNEPVPHLYLADVYDQMGRLAFAEKEILTAIGLSPLSARAYAQLGEFYSDHDRLPEAEKQFQAALRVARTTRGYWGLGLVCWREGRYTEAERAFLEAKALDPSSARAHVMLGLLYTDMQRTREARTELEAGLKIDPANPQALEALKKLPSQGQ